MRLLHRVLSSSPPSDYLKFSSDYSHSVVGGAGSARGMRSASELRDLMDTLQRKKIALENSLRANGSANPSYFSVTQVRPPTCPHPTHHLHQTLGGVGLNDKDERLVASMMIAPPFLPGCNNIQVSKVT